MRKIAAVCSDTVPTAPVCAVGLSVEIALYFTVYDCASQQQVATAQILLCARSTMPSEVGRSVRHNVAVDAVFALTMRVGSSRWPRSSRRSPCRGWRSSRACSCSSSGRARTACILTRNHSRAYTYSVQMIKSVCIWPLGNAELHVDAQHRDAVAIGGQQAARVGARRGKVRPGQTA